MAQERNERETAYGVAVQSLKNELSLAVRLLRHIKEETEIMAIESHVVDCARDAYRHATEALVRIPQLDAHDMRVVYELMDEFRSALGDLNR